MCFCTNAEAAFGWASFIVVNVAFMSLVTWGASTYWILGFVACLVYTILLFVLAFCLDYGYSTNTPRENNGGGGGDGIYRDVRYSQIRNDDDRQENSSNQNEEQQVATTAREPPPSTANNRSERSILVSLLYGLAVLSLGACGFFLPVNLLHCGDVYPRPFPPPIPPDDDPSKKTGHWVTNISALPADIQPWAQQSNNGPDDIDRGDGDSFVYLPTSGVTLFEGHNHQYEQEHKCTAATGSGGSVVWATQPSSFYRREHAPICFNVSAPTEFTLVSDKEACLVAVPATSATHSRFVHCCDGMTMPQAIPATNLPADIPETPHDLISLGAGVVWYKKGYPFDERGQPIFSLDGVSLQEVLHSTFQQDDNKPQPPSNNSSSDDDDNDNPYGPIPHWNEEDCSFWIPRLAAIATLFASAMPILLVSILLWCKKQIPSMGITTYIGVTITAFCIFYAVVGNDESALNNFTDWWCFVSGALGLIVLTDLFFSNQCDKKPLVWAVNFLVLVYVGGLAMLTTRELEDEMWFWILMNFFAFIPLGILGIAMEQVFLVVVCAIGFLADAFRFASFLIDRFFHADDALVMPIYFGVLAMAGLAIAGFGWLLHKYQESLHDSLADWMERHSVSNMILDCCCYDDYYDDYEDDDDDVDSPTTIRTSLLPVTEQQQEEDEIHVPAEQHEDLT